ncbi:MAG: cytochrome C [Bacteroidetes bacterium HGW-Bacteroidetes-23]|nr:MAG: cytochrome C [Bacteroidetes bacterium HGW-Bacteroidetes-23]
MLFFSLGSLIFSDENSTYHSINPSNDELVKSISRGKEVYADFCMQCHLGNGKGSETVPPLAASDWLVNKRKESIHAVKYGQSGPIKVNGKNYNGKMSPMGLTDEEVADVMNYIMNSWGNKQSKMVTVSEVKAVKK